MILFEVCSIQLQSEGGAKALTEGFFREILTESSPPWIQISSPSLWLARHPQLVVASLELTKPLLVLGGLDTGPGEFGVRVDTCGQPRRRDSWSNADAREAGPAI